MTLDPKELPDGAENLDDESNMESLVPVSDKADIDPVDLARFLKRLDPSEPNGGRKYKELLSRMVAFFERKDCSGPDGWAAEVVYRAGRKMATEEIEDLERYCGGIAKMLVKEVNKEQKRTTFIADLSEEKQDIADPSQDEIEEKIDRDRMVDCVRRCIAALNLESQSLVIQYYDSYSGEQIKLRSELAEKIGLTAGALRKHMSDLRKKLEPCAAKCVRSPQHV